MTISDVRKVAQFVVLRGKYVLLRQVQNRLVAAHVLATSRSATPDTANEIVLEQLGQYIRQCEFRCHSLQERYTALGKEILHGTSHQAATHQETGQ